MKKYKKNLDLVKTTFRQYNTPTKKLFNTPRAAARSITSLNIMIKNALCLCWNYEKKKTQKWQKKKYFDPKGNKKYMLHPELALSSK